MGTKPLRDPSRPGCLDFLALLLAVALGFLLLIWSPWAPDEWNVVDPRQDGSYLLRNERWSREYAYPRDRGIRPPPERRSQRSIRNAMNGSHIGIGRLASDPDFTLTDSRTAYERP